MLMCDKHINEYLRSEEFQNRRCAFVFCDEPLPKRMDAKYCSRTHSQRATYALKNYGMTIEAYNFYWSECGGKCMIDPDHTVGEKGLFVDHDHRTGNVRGLICHLCNTALGAVKDSRVTLIGLIDYLNAAEMNEMDMSPFEYNSMIYWGLEEAKKESYSKYSTMKRIFGG